MRCVDVRVKGVVQVAVLTGRVGKVCVEGARYFSNERLLSRVRLAADDPLKTGPILRDLDVLNQNPYRTVYVFYEKGQQPGETDVNFVVKDRMPFRLFGGYENTGNIIAGDSRFLANISWGNLFSYIFFYSIPFHFILLNFFVCILLAES